MEDWIKSKIQAEFKKQKRLGVELCAKLASAKIYEEIKKILYEEIRMERFAYGQGCKEACDKMEQDILCRIYSKELNSEKAVKTCSTRHVIPPKSKDSGILPNLI